MSKVLDFLEKEKIKNPKKKSQLDNLIALINKEFKAIDTRKDFSDPDIIIELTKLEFISEKIRQELIDSYKVEKEVRKLDAKLLVLLATTTTQLDDPNSFTKKEIIRRLFCDEDELSKEMSGVLEVLNGQGSKLISELGVIIEPQRKNLFQAATDYSVVLLEKNDPLAKDILAICKILGPSIENQTTKNENTSIELTQIVAAMKRAFSILKVRNIEIQNDNEPKARKFSAVAIKLARDLDLKISATFAKMKHNVNTFWSKSATTSNNSSKKATTESNVKVVSPKNK